MVAGGGYLAGHEADVLILTTSYQNTTYSKNEITYQKRQLKLFYSFND